MDSRHFVFLAAAVSSTGCGDTCWFDLALAEVTGDVFVVRDCGGQQSGLYRFNLATLQEEPRQFSVGRFSRLSVGPAAEWIGASGIDQRVAFYDQSSNRRTGASQAANGTLGEFLIAPDLSAMWAAVWRGASGIALFDTVGPRVQAFIPVPGSPLAIDLLVAENAIVTASSTEGVIAKIDTGTFETIATASTSGALDLVVLEAERRVVVLEDREQRLTVRDLDTFELIGALPTGEGPRRVAATPNGRYFAVSEREGHAVRVFDRERMEQRAVWSFDGAPEALLFVDDEHLLIGMTEEDQLALVELETGTELGRIEF